jgi:hypothetical protein
LLPPNLLDVGCKVRLLLSVRGQEFGSLWPTSPVILFIPNTVQKHKDLELKRKGIGKMKYFYKGSGEENSLTGGGGRTTWWDRHI